MGNAIASNLSMMLNAPIAMVSVIIGEAGNEAALAMSLSDRILMQQYAIYSPISLHHTVGGPSRERYLTREAAEALMMTAGIARNWASSTRSCPSRTVGPTTIPRQAAADLEYSVYKHLAEVNRISTRKMMKERYKKFRQMGELNPFAHEAIQQEVARRCCECTGPANRMTTPKQWRWPAVPGKPLALPEGLEREVS